jgi:phage portal protein BeeE
MGWWFGRKSAPADARPCVPAWLNSDSQEEGFARSYSEQFEEVYRRNPVGQRAVRLVSGMLGSLTIDGDERAVALVKGDGLLESIAANLLLHGNAYVQLLADERDAPRELCLLRPERVSVISDERGWPVGYLYRAGGQVTRIDLKDPLERQQLAHIKALRGGPDRGEPCDISRRRGAFRAADRSARGLSDGGS